MPWGLPRAAVLVLSDQQARELGLSVQRAGLSA